MSENDPFQKLQEWYLSNCDGDWEHSNVIKIESMDNPGWSLEIDLWETDLKEKPFERIDVSFDDGRWCKSYVKDYKFIAYGGPLQLGELIEIFLKWAGQA